MKIKTSNATSVDRENLNQHSSRLGRKQTAYNSKISEDENENQTTIHFEQEPSIVN